MNGLPATIREQDAEFASSVIRAEQGVPQAEVIEIRSGSQIRRVAAQSPELLWSLFHHLWTSVVGTPGYNKQTWLDAERQLIDAGVIVTKTPTGQKGTEKT